MNLKSFIDSTRQKISSLDYAADAYLNYANSVTGASDENVGDAIMTLAAGYGQGGGGGLEPLIDEVFFLPERTTTAQTITVNYSKNITLPVTGETYMFLWEYLGKLELVPQEKQLVFRKIETDIIHTNTYFIGSQAYVCNSISTSGILIYSTVYGTQTQLSRIWDSYLNINHPAIQTNNNYPSGNWRIRGWKVADAPKV